MKNVFKVIACVLLFVLLVTPIAQAAGEETLATTSKASTGSENYPFSKIKTRVAKYREVNKDVIGWLTIPGTDVNEPVTFNAKNNNYYVQRDWRGTNYPNITWQNWNQYPATATYVDYRTQFGKSWSTGTSRNIVLYGHNWNNLVSPFKIGQNKGYTMFAQLPSYTNIDFATENPYIYFSTGENEGVWKVFAVAYCERKASFPYNKPNPSKEAFTTLIREWKARSMFDFDVKVSSSDRLLTLSTCTRQYGKALGDNQRFVVVARLLRDGESEKDPVKVTVNADMKKPQF